MKRRFAQINANRTNLISMILLVKSCHHDPPASLGKPFEIDFESEPLAGTGLFAITGKTGSRKSTILDALCLALYGVYPRFSENQQQDALPDPSGTRPSIMDGGTILHRVAGNGHAEVEFIGQDGQRYRARREARRARNNPNGRIQSAQRTLMRGLTYIRITEVPLIAGMNRCAGTQEIPVIR